MSIFQLPYSIANRKIAFVALNWGDGHIMRCIPILKQLKEKNNELHLFLTARQEELLKCYVKVDSIVLWQGFSMRFKGNSSFMMEISKKVFRWNKESKILKGLLAQQQYEKQFDLLLSDHVYDWQCQGIKSIFITHQVNYSTPFFQTVINKYHHFKLSRFDELWLLDNSKSELAGDLSKIELFSKKYSRTSSHYVGWPSRFTTDDKSEKKYITFLLTGPEPYRIQLMEEFRNLARSINENVKLVGVKEKELLLTPDDNIELIVGDNLMVDAILKESKLVYSRGGYTTLLDQKVLGFQMMNFPTPGQYEQIYLNVLNKKKASN